MRFRLQEIQLLLRGIPVGANAFEAAGAVVQRVRHGPKLHVVVTHHLAVEVHPAVDMARTGAPLGARREFSLHRPSPWPASLREPGAAISSPPGRAAAGR